jgi:Zn-dependent peptidase ImmA (M78 family)/transcriptional regulator with XRE-family HTH domain
VGTYDPMPVDDEQVLGAAEVAALIDHRRLRLAREIRGWTQKELLDQAGRPITPPALSQLERGNTRPSPETMAVLAAALDFPLAYFASRRSTANRDDIDTEPAGYFRSLRSTSVRDRRQALGHAHLAHELVAAIENRIRLPAFTVPVQLTTASTSQDEIEAIAGEVRQSFVSPPGPVDHVVRTLERHGVVVVRLLLELKKVDAFSVNFDDRPVVVLTSDKFNRYRSRFDAAHELGHLVMHRDVGGWERQAENQAHWFAAAFLMPKSDIVSNLPTTADWRRLIDLKATWKVSMAALLKRAQTLDVMADHTYTNAMKAMSARGWRTREPGDNALGPPEAPVLLETALVHLQRRGVELAELAYAAALPLDLLTALVTQASDPRPQLEL